MAQNSATKAFYIEHNKNNKHLSSLLFLTAAIIHTDSLTHDTTCVNKTIERGKCRKIISVPQLF